MYCEDNSNCVFVKKKKHHLTVSQQLWEGNVTGRIYRRDFTFNLQQKKKKKEGGDIFAVALLPQSAKENRTRETAEQD